jgi:hypothetical protein
MSFLPMTSEEVKSRGWDYVDFVFITGDSYVDHPSFGVSIISRVQTLTSLAFLITRSAFSAPVATFAKEIVQSQSGALQNLLIILKRLLIKSSLINYNIKKAKKKQKNTEPAV